jgi:hypothetical protein
MLTTSHPIVARVLNTLRQHCGDPLTWKTDANTELFEDDVLFVQHGGIEYHLSLFDVDSKGGWTRARLVIEAIDKLNEDEKLFAIVLNVSVYKSVMQVDEELLAHTDLDLDNGAMTMMLLRI